jgi:hypothetical protein
MAAAALCCGQLLQNHADIALPLPLLLMPLRPHSLLLVLWPILELLPLLPLQRA